MSVLEQVLNILDAPGGGFRRGLDQFVQTGNPVRAPLGFLEGMMNPELRPEGRDVATNMGFAPNDTERWDPGDIAGLLIDFGGDPLNVIPAGAASKVGKLLKNKAALATGGAVLGGAALHDAVQAATQSFPMAKGMRPTMKAMSGGRASDPRLFGKQPYMDVTNTPEFRKWFGKSKVVDDAGLPRFMQHGTGASFTEFQKGDIGYHFGTKAQANSRIGSIMDHENLMREIGEYYPGDFPGQYNIMPNFLSIQNPLRMRDITNWDFPTFVNDELLNRGIMGNKMHRLLESSTLPSALRLGETRDLIKREGYDGIVYLNRHEALKDASSIDTRLLRISDDAFRQAQPHAMDSYIAFDPTQIKSAIGNRGTFSPTDPNITHSLLAAALGVPAATAYARAQR